MLYNCMKLHLNSFNGLFILFIQYFKRVTHLAVIAILPCGPLTERTRNSIANDQKGNNCKNIQSRVMVLVHDTLSHCALQVHGFSSVQLTERTRNFISLCYTNNLKNIHAKVMVLVHDTSSQSALQMYEVSLKYTERN